MPSVVLIASSVVLWFFPLWIFHPVKPRLGSFDQRGWPSGRNLALAVVDVVRAAVGGALLMRGLPGLALTPWAELGVVSGGFALAMIIQTWAWHDEDYVQAPIGFWAGSLLMFGHPILLALALPSAIGGALAFRSWAGAFLCGGLVFAGGGFLIPAQDARLSLALGALSIIPVVFSVVTGRHLGGLRR